jgi:hypothetical protein
MPSVRPSKEITQRLRAGQLEKPTPARVKLSAEAKKLLGLIPSDGVFIGNTTLQRRSKLAKRYWKVRKELVAGGYVSRGKGRGGSVARLVVSGKAAPPIARRKGKLLVRRESELYEPLKKWLAEDWGKDVEGGDFFEALVTGTPRLKKRDGGQWSRPDVTLVQVNSYGYLPEPILEVTTFEVKRFSDAENIRSVYEAAAHSRWAHFSYLVAEVPNPDYEFSERFVSELERFDIGLIFMWQVKKGKWRFEEQEWETDRLHPGPEELNGLLKMFFRASKREQAFKVALGKG